MAKQWSCLFVRSFEARCGMDCCEARCGNCSAIEKQWWILQREGPSNRSKDGCDERVDSDREAMVDFAAGRTVQSFKGWLQSKERSRSLSNRLLVQRSFVRPVVQRMVAKQGAIAKQWWILQREGPSNRSFVQRSFVSPVVQGCKSTADFEAARIVRSFEGWLHFKGPWRSNGGFCSGKDRPIVRRMVAKQGWKDRLFVRYWLRTVQSFVGATIVRSSGHSRLRIRRILKRQAARIVRWCNDRSFVE